MFRLLAKREGYMHDPASLSRHDYVLVYAYLSCQGLDEVEVAKLLRWLEGTLVTRGKCQK